jgi:hypothetical protein
MKHRLVKRPIVCLEINKNELRDSPKARRYLFTRPIKSIHKINTL